VVGKVNAGLKERLKKRLRKLLSQFKAKKGMPLLPVTLNGCYILITLDLSSFKIDMDESISAKYEALGMSKISAAGFGGRNCAFMAFKVFDGVAAFPEGVTRLGIDGGVGVR
jgi:hypothetical protein